MMPPISQEELLAAKIAKQILHDSPQESSELLEELLEEYRSQGREKCALEVRRFQCFALIANLEFDRAQDNLELLSEEAKAAGETAVLGTVEMYFGLIALDQGENTKAVEHFDKAIQIGTEHGDLDLIYRVQTNLAYAQLMLEQFEEALHTLRLNVRHFDPTGKFMGNGTTFYNMAVARIQIACREKLEGRLLPEHIESARHDLEVAQAECKGHSNLEHLVEIHAALYKGVSAGPDEGLAYLHSLKSIIEQCPGAQQINYALVELKLLELKGDWPSFVEAGEGVIQRMKKSRWLAAMRSVLKRTAHAYAKLGKFERAYELLFEATNLDSEGPRRHQMEMASLRLDLQRNKFDQDVLRMRNRTLIERNKILEQEARFDPLSGLLNRRGAEEALQQYTERRIADRFVVALLDIDHFKKINDQFGHAVGDQVIQEFSSGLANSVTNPAKIGRWGGEEFLIVFDIDNEIEMQRVGRELIEEIRGWNWDHVQPGMKVTASCGLAMWTRTDVLDDVIRTADDRLYAVKHGGRNNWQAAA